MQFTLADMDWFWTEAGLLSEITGCVHIRLIYNPGQNYVDTWQYTTYLLTIWLFHDFYPNILNPLPLVNVDLKAVLLASLH